MRWCAHRQFDVCPDGRRFVMVAPLAVDQPRLVLVKNWRAAIE